MAKTRYSISTGAAVGLSAATAKTVLCVLCPAQFGIDLVGYEIGFDGVTASAVPVLVEICSSTAATNSTPGTANTTGTVNQVSGRAITAGFTGFYNKHFGADGPYPDRSAHPHAERGHDRAGLPGAQHPGHRGVQRVRDPLHRAGRGERQRHALVRALLTPCRPHQARPS
jgi:hypothetical protein